MEVKTMSVSDLMHDMSSIVNAVRNTKYTVLVTKYSEPVLALVPIKEYQRLVQLAGVKQEEEKAKPA